MGERLTGWVRRNDNQDTPKKKKKKKHLRRLGQGWRASLGTKLAALGFRYPILGACAPLIADRRCTHR